MTPESYRAMRSRMDAPPGRPVDAATGETVIGPPDDPHWPAPIDYAGVVAVLRRFAPVSLQRVLAVLTAAEMVLPAWHSRPVAMDVDSAADPAEAIDELRGWVATGDPDCARRASRITQQALRLTARTRPEPASEATVPHDEIAINAADAIDQAAEAVFHAVFDGRENGSGASAVWRAAGTMALLRPPDERDEATRAFLCTWWSRCRDRLAFADATSAELQ